VRPPGELPTTITPEWGGGWKIRPPGELPTHVQPDGRSCSDALPMPVPVIVVGE
jgi:hypothetical protein